MITCPMHYRQSDQQRKPVPVPVEATERVGGREYCATCAAWMRAVLGQSAPGVGA